MAVDEERSIDFGAVQLPEDLLRSVPDQSQVLFMGICHMLKPEVVATITDDLLLEYAIPRLLKAVLAGIGKGEKVRVDVKKWYKKRTIDQNATAWGPDYALILAHIKDTTGDSFTPEELHDWHKRKFLGYTESEQYPGLFKPGSTKDLDTAGFAKFRDAYCDFWGMQGLYVPEPDSAKKKVSKI